MMRLSTCVLVLLAGAMAAHAQTGGHEGTWANDHGSRLVVTSVGANGSISGTYANNSPDFACRGVPFPITGWLDGDMISFTTRWQNATSDCKSITAWTGYFHDGRLAVEWVLTYLDAVEGRPKVRTGTDFYRRN